MSAAGGMVGRVRRHGDSDPWSGTVGLHAPAFPLAATGGYCTGREAGGDHLETVLMSLEPQRRTRGKGWLGRHFSWVVQVCKL